MKRCLLAGLVLLLVLPALPAAGTDPDSRIQPEGPDQKIRITADRLIANTKTGSAEFIGNVRATQGSTVITSDRLEVLYDQAGQSGTAAESAAAIKSIVATGHVVIHFDDKIATTAKAVYRSRTGIFILTGKDTRVTSGENAITGDKITVDRKSDRMTVESGVASRVNAVVFTGKEGLSPPVKNVDNGEKPDE